MAPLGAVAARALPMSHASVLGECPDCRERIPEYKLLIEYERSDGRERFAECPSCENVVHPV